MKVTPKERELLMLLRQLPPDRRASFWMAIYASTVATEAELAEYARIVNTKPIDFDAFDRWILRIAWRVSEAPPDDHDELATEPWA
jgi:hypothetical protein